MVVTPTTFKMHLKMVRECFEPVRLSDWLNRRKAGLSLPQKACAITFDDGWRDNFEFALPELSKAGIPATVFAVPNVIESDFRFWPNRLATLVAALPTETFLAEPFFTKLTGSRRLPPAPIREFISELIQSAKELPESEVTEALRELESRYPTPKQCPQLMSWDELRAIQSTGLFDVGSHTCHHVRLLEELSMETMRSEIIESQSNLRERLGTSIDLFCYPNGDVSAAAKMLVSETYLGAVTTRSGINDLRSNSHALARIALHEDNSGTESKFGSRLSGWL